MEKTNNNLDLLDKINLDPMDKINLDPMDKINLDPMDKINLNQIDTLCFAGGGMKGFSFFGGVNKLEELKLIDVSKINKFVGTSAGAIVSFTYACGYTTKEMIEFILTFDFSLLEPPADCLNIFNKFGMSDCNKIIIMIQNFISNKFNKNDVTFEELYNLTGKELIIIGSNLTKLQSEAFSYKTTPKMSITTAVRISISIPVIFNPVYFNNCYYVDGGICDNFPLKHCNKYTTLGFYCNSSGSEINSIKDIVQSCISLLMKTITHKNKDDFSYLIEIGDLQGVFINFNLDNEIKLKIINAGSESVIKFLNKPIHKKYNHIATQTDFNNKKEIKKKVKKSFSE